MKRIIKHIRALSIISVIVFAGMASLLVQAADPSDIELDLVSSERSLYLEPGAVEVRNDIMYRTDVTTGAFFAVDVSTTDHQLLSVAEAEPLNTYETEIVGNYAYVLSYISPSNTDTIITAIDISDPTNMSQVGQYTGPDVACASYNQFRSNGTNLFIQDECSQEIKAIDVSDPTNMSIAGTFDFSSYVTGLASFYQKSFQIRYDQGALYLFDIGDYLYVKLDVSNPASISEIEAVDGTGLPIAGQRDKTMAVTDDIVYEIGNGTSVNEMYVIDVSNPVSPSVINQLSIGPSGKGCFDAVLERSSVSTLAVMCGGYASSDEYGLAVIDVTDPANPVLGPGGGAVEMWYWTVDDGKFYSVGANAFNRNEVYSVTDPAQPPQLVSYDINHAVTNDYTASVLVHPTDLTKAMVFLDAIQVVRTVDISDPNNLEVANDTILTYEGSPLKNFIMTGNPAYSSTGQSVVITSSQWSSPELGYLAMLNVSDPANPTVVDVEPVTAGREFVSSQVEDDVVYVIESTGPNSFLTTYEIDEVGQQLTLLDSQQLTRYNSREVEVVGSNALVFTPNQTDVDVLDITDPSSIGVPAAATLPVTVSYSYSSSTAVPFSIGTQMFMAGDGELFSIDVSDPFNMLVTSSVVNARLGGHAGGFEPLALNVTDSNELIHSNRSGDHYVKIDVTDPANISITDFTPESGTFPSGMFPENLEGFGNMWWVNAFVGDTFYALSQVADSNFYSVNAADLANPQPLDVLTQLVPFYEPNSLAFYGNFALIGNREYDQRNAELSVFDITDPANLDYVGGPVHDYQEVLAIEVQGDYAYATRYWSEMVVYDLSNPTFPLAIEGAARSSDRSYAYDLDIVGNYIYVADDSKGLVVHDITDPTTAPEIARFEDANFTGLRSLEVSGNYVYGVSNSEDVLMVIDVSNPASPSTVTTVSDAGFDELDDIKLVGDRLYITGKGSNSGANFSVVDISNPASPSLIGQLVTTTSAQFDAVEVYGDFAFVAASGDNAVHTIDLEDETSPTVLESTSSGSLAGANELELHNGQLYVLSARASSMNIYDITLADAPVDPDPDPDPDPPVDPDPTPDPDDPVTPTDPDDPDTPADSTDPDDPLAATGFDTQRLLVGSAVLLTTGAATTLYRKRQPLWKRN